MIDPSGEATYLETTTGLPVGLNWNLPYVESIALLRPGETLVLYTDGLVDRRDVAVDDGLEQLLEVASDQGGRDLDDFCGILIERLVPADASDDVAILAAHFEPVEGRLSLTVPAGRARLGSVRRNLGRWLSGHAVPKADADDIILASSEACANSIEHAYGPAQGSVDIEAEVRAGEITIVVRDRGTWKAARNGDRRRGLSFVEACMDSCTVTKGGSGAGVRMQRRVGRSLQGSASWRRSRRLRRMTSSSASFPERSTSNAAALELLITEAVPNSVRGLVLDLSALSYIDSSGIRLLLSLAGSLRWRGQDLVLAVPVGSQSRRVFSMAGSEDSVAIEAAGDAARARLRADGSR